MFGGGGGDVTGQGGEICMKRSRQSRLKLLLEYTDTWGKYYKVLSFQAQLVLENSEISRGGQRCLYL